MYLGRAHPTYVGCGCGCGSGGCRDAAGQGPAALYTDPSESVGGPERAHPDLHPPGSCCNEQDGSLSHEKQDTVHGCDEFS
jgi:hypothetical protein